MRRRERVNVFLLRRVVELGGVGRECRILRKDRSFEEFIAAGTSAHARDIRTVVRPFAGAINFKGVPRAVPPVRGPKPVISIKTKFTPITRRDYGIPGAPAVRDFNTQLDDVRKALVSRADDGTKSWGSEDLARRCVSDGLTGTAKGLFEGTVRGERKSSEVVVEDAAFGIAKECVTADLSGPDKVVAQKVLDRLIAQIRQPVSQVVELEPEAVPSWLYRAGRVTAPDYADPLPATTGPAPGPAADSDDDDDETEFVPLGVILLLAALVLLGLFFVLDQRRRA